eukprot:TRINITY_DN3496_c0_g1_i2.p1 TRINITY_DN3496_c0_g1~~TRINITY_DN3496_c0_g1_i2.p1  ORF type:complete len:399 (+),score=150.99 TRINITY_DN3496_c0_g1_i2:133-1329(+)
MGSQEEATPNTYQKQNFRLEPGTTRLSVLLEKKYEQFYHFLIRCLAYDPLDRMKPEEALAHPFLFPSVVDPYNSLIERNELEYVRNMAQELHESSLSHKATVKKLEQELEQLKEKTGQENQELLNRIEIMADEKTELEQNHKNKTEELEGKHKHILEELEENHKKQMSGLEEKYQEELRDNVRSNELKMQAQITHLEIENNDLKDQIAEFAEKQLAEKESLKEKYQQQFDRVKGERNNLRKKAENLEAEVNRLNQLLQEKAVKNEVSKKPVVSKTAKSFDKILDDHVENLKSKNEPIAKKGKEVNPPVQSPNRSNNNKRKMMKPLVEDSSEEEKELTVNKKKKVEAPKVVLQTPLNSKSVAPNKNNNETTNTSTPMKKSLFGGSLNHAIKLVRKLGDK